MGSATDQEAPLRIRKQPNSPSACSRGGVNKRAFKMEHQSIKYRSKAHEGAHFDIVDFVQEECSTSLPENMIKRSKLADPKAAEILTTAELITAVGHLWECASRPFSFVQTKLNSRCHGIDSQEEHGGHYIGEVNSMTPTSSDCKFFSVDFKIPSISSPIVQPTFENVSGSEQISSSEIGSNNCTRPLFSKLLQSVLVNINDCSKVQMLASVRTAYNLKPVYKWMHEITPAVDCLAKTGSEEKNFNVTTITGGSMSSESPSNAVKQSRDSVDDTEVLSSPSCTDEETLWSTNAPSTSKDYCLKALQHTECIGCCSQLYACGHARSLGSVSCVNKESQHKVESDLLEDIMKETEKYIVESGAKSLTCLAEQDKPHHTSASEKHAFAGALAGIFVSLCLHPVDTVKTVVQFQSTKANQSSIVFISRSIISDRGLIGLYRGITSNVASSAPISALYTYTYESVKGALLPLISKEYYSFAHCVAGGCASIATSIVFTPSERIKQQMQVRPNYQNCWNALIGLLRSGGLRSLYTGWGAVLCRNVPHSIIKFYTYESLKQLMMSSLQPNGQLDTFQTLVCGGLAGSTAALFTTPFDVVKTRLQTQIPGSVSQYSGVLCTLQQIHVHEGFKGLYRGLIPRLIMYMSQGALFFASYESFKRVFSLDVPQLANVVQCEPSSEDESKLSMSSS